MKIRNIFLILIIFNMSHAALSQKITIPGPYQWENRVLLLFSSAEENQYQEQINIWHADDAGMKERDLVLFFIDKDTVTTPDGQKMKQADHLRTEFDVKAGQFTVILIGKDGMQKLKQENILTQEKLYAIIDGMPMRRREMRRESENGY